MNEKYITYRASRNMYQITIRVNGKIVTKQAKTIEEARHIRAELIRQYKLDENLFLKIHNKAMVINDNLTFGDAWEYYKKNDILKRELTPSTLYKYAQCYALIAPFIKRLKIKDINYEIWQDLFSALQERRNLGYKYINTHKNRVKAMYQYFIKLGVIKQNPLVNVNLKQTRTESKIPFTEKEKVMFLRCAKEYDYRLFFLFNLYFETGCRRGELLALQWQDVDFVRKSIHIRHSISKGFVNGIYTEYFGNTKTEKSKREIPVRDKTLFMLHMFYKQKNPAPTSFVFTASEYCHVSKYPFISLSRVTSAFAYIRDISGINEKLTIHSIRHYFTSKLVVVKHVDLKTVQELGGWASSRILLDTYTHSQIDIKRRALGI